LSPIGSANFKEDYRVNMETGNLMEQVNDLINSGATLKEVQVEIERKVLIRALAIADGNKAKAARHLGLNRTTLVQKMKKFQML